MRMKHALFALALVSLVLQQGTASAGPTRQQLGVRWEGTLEPEASKLVVYNLSARPAKAFLGSRAFSIPTDRAAEIPAAGLGTETIRLRSTAELLVLQALDGFDAGSVQIDKSSSSGPQQAGAKLLHESVNPEWTRELTADGPRVRHGALGAIALKSDDAAARVEVAVELLTPHTSIRIRQLDTWGNEITSLVAAASQPVRWRALLGPVNGESRIELRTLQGEAQATAAVAAAGDSSTTGRSPIAPLEKAGGGIGKFEPAINWQNSPDLYYRVTGGPPNVCGDSYVSRNGGPYVVTGGWMCLDANGNGVKGPWTWSNQNGTEIAYAYMVWSNGLSTNTDKHIWDKTGPWARITSPSASPAPISFYGTGNDEGAGYSSSWGSSCHTTFFEHPTPSTPNGRYWDPYTNQYINTSRYEVPCTISGMPSLSVTWNQSTIPPGYTHFSGRCYTWAVVLRESTQSNYEGWDNRYFCVP